MRKLGTFWVDYNPMHALSPHDKTFLVKRAKNTLIHKPGEVLSESEIKSLVLRGYEVFIDKAK